LKLIFAEPMKRIELVRIGVADRHLLPMWTMKAYDPYGQQISSTGEHGFYHDKQAKRFRLDGPNIGELRIESDSTMSSPTTFKALPIAELLLETDRPTTGPPTTVTIRIPANAELATGTGVRVREGETLTIEASGNIEAAGPDDRRAFYHAVSPNGRNQRFDTFPDPELPALSLVGYLTYGKGVFFVGESFRLKAGLETGSGWLTLRINDDVVSDNQGEWVARITVEHASSEEQNSKVRVQPSAGEKEPYGLIDDEGLL
jgi:hypothetical protein